MPQSPNPATAAAPNIWKIATLVLGFALLFTFSALLGSISNRRVAEAQTPTATLEPTTPTFAPSPLAASELISLATADKIKGKVIGVSDGDTITVLDEKNVSHKVRLQGIDAPESAQAFGEKSKQNLSALVFGKTVEVVTSKKDKYGRTVGKVLVDGTDANLKQIKDGFAWHYKEYAAEQSEADRKLYADTETSARAFKSGLWIDANPTAPWSWRHGEEKALDGAIIVGNKNSSIYHWAGCPGFNKISAKNRVVFRTIEEAETAGYRAAKNCTASAPRSQTETGDEDEPTLEAELSEPTIPQPRPFNYSSPTPYPTAPPSYSRSTPPSRVEADDSDTVASDSNSPDEHDDSATTSSSATARCADGTLSYSANRRGTCSHHGGVAEWLDGSSASPSSPSYSTPNYSTPPSSSGGTVQVRGYYRKDGTYVRPHTRSAPRRRN